MKLVVTVQIDARDARVGVLEAPQISRIPAETQVVVEGAHQARADVPAEHVVRRRHLRDRPAVDLRPQQAPSTPR